MNSIRRICRSLAGPPRRAGQPATMAKASRRRPMIAPRLLPRTVQLCIHCRQSPAGFWVSHKSSKTVRRPWCLSCCDGLDRNRSDMIAFDS